MAPLIPVKALSSHQKNICLYKRNRQYPPQCYLGRISPSLYLIGVNNNWVNSCVARSMPSTVGFALLEKLYRLL